VRRADKPQPLGACPALPFVAVQFKILHEQCLRYLKTEGRRVGRGGDKIREDLADHYVSVTKAWAM
jgi:hypothetical protein